MPTYAIEILDNNLNRLAVIQNTVEIDKTGYFLEYSSRLSAWGTCKFRVATKDPLFTATGDILQPFANHVRIKRYGVTVWQGVIVKNPARTKNYIEVLAYEYLYLLSRVLVRHDPADGQGAENYRTASSGTMAVFLTTILNEAKTDMGKPLTNMTIGTIDNPSFPVGYNDATGVALTGPWTFSTSFPYKVDYQTIYYVLQAFGNYAQFDFELTKDMVLNFRSYIGNKQPGIVFSYQAGNAGNIEDYNVPLDGDHMANYLQGIAADNSNNVLHADGSDLVSIGTYGKIMGVAAFADAKDVNVLRTRLTEELKQVSSPNREVHVFVDPNKSYPLGQYAIGDSVTYQIKDHIINVNAVRRIVGLDVKVHVTGKEQVRHVTNVPRDAQ